MFKHLPRSLRCSFQSFTKQRFSTTFSVSRRGVESSFDSPYSLEEVLSKATALPSSSDFLQDLLSQVNSGNALTEKQESWVRYFVWEAEKPSDKSNYEIAGPKQFTVARRTGEVETFNTELSLGEAASICKQIKRQNDFVQSLIRCHDGNRLSPRQTPWLFKLAQEETQKNGTQPKPIYTIVRHGKSTHFECDWSLQKAYETLKNNSNSEDQFSNSILNIYEKYGERMMQERQAWLFWYALKATGEVNDGPRWISSPNNETRDEKDSNIYTITRYGQTEEFECDWPLEKAFEIVQSGIARKNEFQQSLLDSFQRDGENMSRRRKAWLLKFALDISALSKSGEELHPASSEASQSLSSGAHDSSGVRNYTLFRKDREINFETALSIPQAVALIDEDDKKNQFRDDLVENYKKHGKLTEKQLSWIAFFGHQLEKDIEQKSRTEEEVNEIKDEHVESESEPESDSDSSDDEVSEKSDEEVSEKS